MSMNFNKPVNDEALSRIKEIYGDPVANDRMTLLFDKMKEIRQPDMKEIANLAGQPVSVEVHEEGETKTMSDGTRYQVTPKGWRKIQ